MSFAGYAIREFGGAWGETARGVFLVGAFALLVILVTSAAMRRHLRVFVSKHFYRNKYDYRVEWLRFSKTLSARDATDVHAHQRAGGGADARLAGRRAVHARRIGQAFRAERRLAARGRGPAAARRARRRTIRWSA